MVIIASMIALPTFTSTMIFIIVATIGSVGIHGMPGIIATRAPVGMCASVIMITIIGIGPAARAGAVITIRGGIVMPMPVGARVGVGMILIGIIIPTCHVGVAMLMRNVRLAGALRVMMMAAAESRVAVRIVAI